MNEFVKQFQQLTLMAALQTVLGLIGVAVHNPQSSTFRIYEKTLLTMRNMLCQVFPVEQIPLPVPGASPIPSLGARQTDAAVAPQAPTAPVAGTGHEANAATTQQPAKTGAVGDKPKPPNDPSRGGL